MFHVDERLTTVLDEYDNVVVSLEAGTHDWKIDGKSPEPAVRIRVDRDGKYDPVSSSIIPVGYLPEVLRIALEAHSETDD